MIPDYLKNESEASETFDSNEIRIAFNEIIATAFSFERANSMLGQYATADAKADKLRTLPSTAVDGNKRKNNPYKKDENALLALQKELENFPNSLEMDCNELTLILAPNDQINYIFIIDTLGEVWYENETDQFQQILKIDTNHFPNGSYHILMENNGSFTTKIFVKK